MVDVAVDSAVISNCTWMWNSFWFFHLIISSPPLSVSASVRMDSPPGSHSRPRNHRHSRAVICAQTRCCSIDCPAWPNILCVDFTCRHRRRSLSQIFSPHYSHTLFFACGSLLYFVFTVFCSAPDNDESCVVSATLPKFRFFFCILRFWFFFLWFFLFDFFDFSFSNVKQKQKTSSLQNRFGIPPERSHDISV